MSAKNAAMYKKAAIAMTGLMMLGGACSAPVFAQATSPAPVADSSPLAPPFTHEGGVIDEVLTAADGGYRLRGYVVRWRDSAVYVTGSPDEILTKGETAWLSTVSLAHDLGFIDLSVCFECGSQFRFRAAEVQIPDVDIFHICLSRFGYLIVSVSRTSEAGCKIANAKGGRKRDIQTHLKPNMLCGQPAAHSLPARRGSFVCVGQFFRARRLGTAGTFRHSIAFSLAGRDTQNPSHRHSMIRQSILLNRATLVYAVPSNLVSREAADADSVDRSDWNHRQGGSIGTFIRSRTGSSFPQQGRI